MTTGGIIPNISTESRYRPIPKSISTFNRVGSPPVPGLRNEYKSAVGSLSLGGGLSRDRSRLMGDKSPTRSSSMRDKLSMRGLPCNHSLSIGQSLNKIEAYQPSRINIDTVPSIPINDLYVSDNDSVQHITVNTTNPDNILNIPKMNRNIVLTSPKTVKRIGTTNFGSMMNVSQNDRVTGSSQVKHDPHQIYPQESSIIPLMDQTTQYHQECPKSDIKADSRLTIRQGSVVTPRTYPVVPRTYTAPVPTSISVVSSRVSTSVTQSRIQSRIQLRPTESQRCSLSVQPPQSPMSRLSISINPTLGTRSTLTIRSDPPSKPILRLISDKQPAKTVQTKTSLNKTNIIFILLSRRIEHTRSQLDTMKLPDLKLMLGNITSDEKILLQEQVIKRKNYNGDINYNASLRGIPKSYTKDAKVDCLLNEEIMVPITLNQEQRNLFNSLGRSLSIVTAGPGSGKTTSLVEIVSYLSSQNLRVLVLMYGISVEAQFKHRLKALDIKLQPLTQIRRPSGSYVATFHKYAWNSRGVGSSDGTFLDMDIDDFIYEPMESIGATESSTISFMTSVLDSNQNESRNESRDIGDVSGGVHKDPESIIKSNSRDVSVNFLDIGDDYSSQNEAPNQHNQMDQVGLTPDPRSHPNQIEHCMASNMSDSHYNPTSQSKVTGNSLSSSSGKQPKTPKVFGTPNIGREANEADQQNFDPDFLGQSNTSSYDTSSTNDKFGGDYDSSIQEAVTRAPSSQEVWDYVIIDEAQDLKRTYYDLIQTIRTSHVIYMGDARQEINSGATAYSKLVSENQRDLQKLHMNHRSTQEIVSVLNQFSRNNFCPQVDIQQRSNTSVPDSVVIVRTKDEAQTAAAYIAEYPLGSTFAISPVTVRKYNVDDTVTQIRQELYEKGRKIMVTESGRSIDPKEDYITNSKLVKGLERDQVVLFGVSNTSLYSDYNVPIENLKCLLYVAMSRAKKRLVIIVDEDKYVSPNLLDSCLVDLNLPHRVSNVSQRKMPSNPIPIINVTDLAEYNFDPQRIDEIDTQQVHIDREGIEDCVGFLVEAHLASSFGALCNSYSLNSIRSSREALTYLQDGTYQCDVANKSRELNNLFRELNSSLDSPEYTYTRAMYISRIQRDWTVSESLKAVSLDLSRAREDVISLIGPEIRHSTKKKYPVPIDRSEQIGGYIYGEFDLSSQHGIVEVKHAHENVKHLNQAAIYSKISGLPVYIVNTLCGKIMPVLNGITDFDRYVRAILIMREAHICRIGSDVPLPSGVIISVDTEFTFNGGGNVYEIGAVAFDPVEGKIISVFQEISGCVPMGGIGGNPNEGGTNGSSKGFQVPILGVTEANTPGVCSNEFFLQLTGLKITGTPDPSMIYRFQEWISAWPQGTVIQWAGSDSDLLGIRKGIDLMAKYKIHLSQCSGTGRARKSGLRLTDAVEDIFPPKFPFHAHRAFEDAAMTMGVYIAMLLKR